MKVLYAADLRECSSKDLMCRVSVKIEYVELTQEEFQKKMEMK